jgi:hypothetical protein
MDEKLLPYGCCEVRLGVGRDIHEDRLSPFRYMGYTKKLHQGEVLGISDQVTSDTIEIYKVVCILTFQSQ